MSTVYHIESIHELHQLAGMSAKHPLFAVLRIENLSALGAGFPHKLSYGFYTIGLKKNLNGYVKYGRTSYDFQEGTLGFSAPLQTIEFNSDIMVGASGWMIFFHRDLLNGSSLSEKFNDFGFFSYNVNEGLHLSREEEASLDAIFNNIEQEYNLPIDQHSKQVVISNLELLLTYAQRYYSRQFIVRNDVKPDLLVSFEKALNGFFKKRAYVEGLPSVEYFADQLHLSPNYLSDFLKSVTGKSAMEHIHFQIIESAKELLIGTNKAISEIAFELGFEYPQYFSRLFKNKTGMTPKEFRLS